ncbi:MAG: hypothetical protein PWR10_2378 [Halanaerobiales bacterium]|nr:hypothetical protein [Halanaerobiales bacterium]
MFKKILAFFFNLEKITLYLTFFFFIISTILIMTQVVTRYVFSFSFAWVEELSRYLIIYVVLLGSSIVLKKDEHPRVELIYDLLPARLKYWLNYFFYLLIFFFLVILTWQGIESCIFCWNDYSASMRIRMTIPYAAVPIGGVLMACQCIALAFRNYSTNKKNQ